MPCKSHILIKGWNFIVLQKWCINILKLCTLISERMMKMQFVWDAIILIFVGTVLLRISGRKSIAQMTIAQTVVMISIGTIITQPIVEKSVWKAIVAASTFIGFLLLVEYLNLKFNFIEKFMAGKAKVVIQEGQVVTQNLRKLRFTIDQLEQQLRIQGISRIQDVKTATLEANGQIGYELAQHAKPVTYGELITLLQSMNVNVAQPNTPQGPTIFDEVIAGRHMVQNPKNLH